MQGGGKQDLHLSRGGGIADPEQNPTWQGESKQDLCVDYSTGKSTQHVSASYGTRKPDYESEPEGKSKGGIREMGKFKGGIHEVK